jgi:hypothetical protein
LSTPIFLAILILSSLSSLIEILGSLLASFKISITDSRVNILSEFFSFNMKIASALASLAFLEHRNHEIQHL